MIKSLSIEQYLSEIEEKLDNKDVVRNHILDYVRAIHSTLNQKNLDRQEFDKFELMVDGLRDLYVADGFKITIEKPPHNYNSNYSWATGYSTRNRSTTKTGSKFKDTSNKAAEYKSEDGRRVLKLRATSTSTLKVADTEHCFPKVVKVYCTMQKKTWIQHTCNIENYEDKLKKLEEKLKLQSVLRRGLM